MLFEARELKPYAEPVTRSDLLEGGVYFSVNFIDANRTIPVLKALVFVGFNLEAGDSGKVYFQDAASYWRGARYFAADGGRADFYQCSDDEISHVFEYEHAVDRLLACSLRRRKIHE